MDVGLFLVHFTLFFSFYPCHLKQYYLMWPGIGTGLTVTLTGSYKF